MLSEKIKKKKNNLKKERKTFTCWLYCCSLLCLYPVSHPWL